MRSKFILYLLQISSLQLEFIKHFSPDILVYTNISPDHLDRHGSMEEYINMKLNALMNMKQEGQIVYNKDDAILEKVLSPFPHKKQPFSTKSKDVLIITAGNIPIVGFHDLLCVLICGHKAILKISSKDNILMKYIIDYNYIVGEDGSKLSGGIRQRLGVARAIYKEADLYNKWYM